MPVQQGERQRGATLAVQCTERAAVAEQRECSDRVSTARGRMQRRTGTGPRGVDCARDGAGVEQHEGEPGASGARGHVEGALLGRVRHRGGARDGARGRWEGGLIHSVVAGGCGVEERVDDGRMAERCGHIERLELVVGAERRTGRGSG